MMRSKGASRRVSWILGVASLGLAIAFAAPAGARADPAKPPVHAPGPLAHHKVHRSARSRAHHTGAGKAAPVGSGLTGLAGCYGRFIAWRDELSALMLQASSYTPWPDDRIRFDRMERAFSAGAKRYRRLDLVLQPTFSEADFPPDVRQAFQAGVRAASAAFADGGYRHTQILVVGQPDLSPRQRMAQLEANADQVFAPLSAPCDHLAGL